MRIFKTRYFDKWAAKEGIGNAALISAVAEIGRELISYSEKALNQLVKAGALLEVSSDE